MNKKQTMKSIAEIQEWQKENRWDKVYLCTYENRPINDRKLYPIEREKHKNIIIGALFIVIGIIGLLSVVMFATTKNTGYFISCALFVFLPLGIAKILCAGINAYLKQEKT